MAVTVIAGLAASTLLTLIGIPVIYSLLDRVGRFDAQAALPRLTRPGLVPKVTPIVSDSDCLSRGRT